MKRLITLAFLLSLILSSCTQGVVEPPHYEPVYAPVDTLVPDALLRPDTSRPSESDAPDTTAPDSTDMSEPAQSERVYDRIVYITFDDGPCGYTQEVLSILDEYGVKATFFAVGENIEDYPDAARAIVDGGHALGCHSVEHDYAAIYKNAAAIKADLCAWERIVADTVGYIPSERLYRFPGGTTCSAIKKGSFGALHAAIGDMGYRAFDWMFGNNDRWDGGRREGQTRERYLKESFLTSYALGGEPYILLLHETSRETVDMLGWMIEYLEGDGCGFATLAELDGEFIFNE